MFTGSEDVSWFAREAGVPLVYWFWGGSTRRLRRRRGPRHGQRGDPDQPLAVLRSRPAPHDRARVDALVVAAREFLA
jgi:hippurate hydrolase